MFCYQCEQASQGTGCTNIGVCGKKPSTAGLQDLLVHQLKGISYFAQKSPSVKSSKSDQFVLDSLFTTVTNVNFDDARIIELLKEGEGIRAEMAAGSGIAQSEWPASASFQPAADKAELEAQADSVGVKKNIENEDIHSLQQILLYGVKGLAAYVHHAAVMGKSDAAVTTYIYQAMDALNQNLGMEELVKLCMDCGNQNIRAMEILDEGHTERFGHPEPTPVSVGTLAGPAIIVSGHDLPDLENLLKATEGTGVNIYTHGEMLPAHGYPGLKRYKHLAGHFGTAWQNQIKEFDNVPAAILFTTNCIQKPKESYKDRVFTTGLVAYPEIQHVPNNDFSAVIAKAKSLGGFEKQEGKSLLTGFGRNAVLGVADKVIEAVKSGAIKHFLLVGGCDGAKPGRNYFTELVEKSPKDTVILTLACGKFRFNHLELGDIGGIPRLLDIGQCNDAYSAVKIALALADAFECGVNDLPLSLVLSWYEQKAVVILLSLFALGIKNIRLGPTLPAFITPNVLNFLVENFECKPIGTAEEDLQAILA